ncbi:ABC transporter ATP-binding protein [Gorillibacterium timonense]|uniref:ABC transporter ATP-binding protein n=1 Tax=Gorillibacterium timonense TaxID=1689269 RepID=UPI0009E8C007|nr:ABC transporter ATP-binding protein [Gorillibacterium timonense]
MTIRFWRPAPSAALHAADQAVNRVSLTHSPSALRNDIDEEGQGRFGAQAQAVRDTAAEPDPLLEVRNLRVSFSAFRGEVKAVQGVSFILNRGETLAIVGESGSGKSVTARSLMRLLPKRTTRQTTGSIRFKGREILTLDAKELRRIRGAEIGMIFQDALSALNPTMTIGEQLMEGLLYHKHLSKREARAIAIKMLVRVGIPQPELRLKQHLHEFSGGMRQRIMIAMAAVCGPDILIADEPTTALDVTIQAQIIELFQELQRELGVAIVLITHDLGVVAKIADRVNIMYAGQIVESGTVDEIFYRPQHPYTLGLLASMPRLDQNKDEPLEPIPGSPPDLFAPPAGCPFAARCERAMEVCSAYPPQMTPVADGHQVACWLQDPRSLRAAQPSVKTVIR